MTQAEELMGNSSDMGPTADKALGDRVHTADGVTPHVVGDSATDDPRRHGLDAPFAIDVLTQDVMRDVVENARDAIIITSVELEGPDSPVIVYVNGAFEIMTGWRKHEIIGLTPRVLQGPKTSRELLNRLKADLLAGRPFSGETVNYRKDGSEYYVEWRISAVWRLGSRVYWVAIQRDATERVAREHEIQRQNEELQRITQDLERRVDARTRELQASVRDMKAFTHTVAHDLRAPLRGILATCEFIEEDLGDTIAPLVKEHCARQRDSVTKLAKLVEDLLSLTRLGSIAARPTRDVDINSVVREALDHVRIEAEEHGGMPPLDLVLEEGMHATADAGLLGLVMENLLGNAVKYREPTRPLRIEVGTIDDGLYVRDNGVGFDMKFAEKIFEHGERLHNPAVHGTGFGLGSARSIVDKHGGHIWAESVKGVGSTFSFTLSSPPSPPAV